MHGEGYFLAKKVGRWQQDRIRKKVLKTAREKEELCMYLQRTISF